MASSQVQLESEQRTDTPPLTAPTQKPATPKLAAPQPAEDSNKGDWRGLLRRIPSKAYWIALLLVAAIALFTWRFSILGETATLKLKLQHSFKTADIAVYIDGEARYSGKLSGTPKRRFGFRNNAEGSFSRTFHLHPGSHLVRVQVKSPDGYNETNEVSLDIGPEKERMLTVTADRRAANLKMAAQTPEAVATQATPSWYQNYFTSLSLTISGTLVSMLFGYLIQQLVGLFRKKPPVAS